MLCFSFWQKLLVWLIVVLGIVLALPNILPRAFLACLPPWYARLHLPMGLDLRGGTRLVAQLPGDKAALREGVISVIAQRLGHSGREVQDYTVAPRGKDRISIEAPGFFDVQYLKDLVSTRAVFSLHVVDDRLAANDIITGKASLPANTELVYSFDDPPVGYLVHKEALLSSAGIMQASAVPGTGTGHARLQLTLSGAGAARLNDVVAAGKRRILAAVVDGEVLETLHLTAPVRDGRLSVGPMDGIVAQNLATVMNSGPLPVSINLVEERTVGADLGDNHAQSGLMATIAALLVVAVFMILSYGFPGVLADCAIAANIALLLAVLSLAGIPLTLAGFAGVVLTIGVSVDAIILIFERIREDRRHACRLAQAGYALAQPIQSGFNRASGTIIDANVTILIAALALFLLGAGPVHGFALTVTAGILISLFTTFIVTPLLAGRWLCRCPAGNFSTRALRIIPAETRIGFMRLGKLTLGIAALLTLLSAGLYFAAGVHYGIDFSGGSVAVLKARHGRADIMDISARANELNIDSLTVRGGDNPARAVISIGAQGGGEDAEQTVAARLRGEFGADYSLERMDVVGPAVSGTLGRSTLYALLLSLTAVFIYIRSRFGGRFAMGAVMTTLHDMTVLAGFFVFFQWEFNLWSVAAVLAVIGYSLNDTIVVYDRIRSLLKQQGGLAIAALVDLAINKTLSRTVLTSLAMLLAHIPLYCFGGADMRSFASVLLAGVMIGTYSSIFIAGPLLVLLGVRPASTSLSE